MSKSNDVKKRRRQECFDAQNGRCYWCGDLTVMPVGHSRKPAPKNLATLDHLRHKSNPKRREPAKGEARYVMACWQCNHDRGEAMVKGTPLAQRWKTSGRAPRQQDAAE